MKYWESDEFKKLQKIFEQKLKDTGFVDAERTVRRERLLIQYASNVYRQSNSVNREAKSEYYSLISEHINKTHFRNNLDESIMRLLSQGEKISEIVRKINDSGVYVHRQTVRFIIRRYEDKWKIKAWKPKQMNLKAPTR